MFEFGAAALDFESLDFDALLGDAEATLGAAELQGDDAAPAVQPPSDLEAAALAAKKDVAGPPGPFDGEGEGMVDALFEDLADADPTLLGCHDAGPPQAGCDPVHEASVCEGLLASLDSLEALGDEPGPPTEPPKKTGRRRGGYTHGVRGGKRAMERASRANRVEVLMNRIVIQFLARRGTIQHSGHCRI